MSQPFDMELFLAGVLAGSHATRQRHTRQAKVIQEAIAKRWQRYNPWTWQRKHLAWFLEESREMHAVPTHSSYILSVELIVIRLGKSWRFRFPSPINRENVGGGFVDGILLG